ncbi:MAG TPA: nuclear transport factor 2 family protein [Actinomycetota bacterium]
MTPEALRSWLDAYGRAWETRDPEAAVELFSPDATYRETPFDEIMEGREVIRQYWQQVPDYQRDIEFGYEIVAVEPVVVRWWSAYTKISSGDRVKLDGVFLLEFDEAGFCTSLREWWHADETPAS